MTHVPARRPLVTTPQFWIYIMGGLILVFVVASQFGLLPNRSERVAQHPDLNSTERVDPAVPAQSERARTVAPQTQPAPVDSAIPVPPQNGALLPQDTQAKAVRMFEPPAPSAAPVPKPAMPQAAPPTNDVADHVEPAAVAAPVAHPDVKPVQPPPPVVAKPEPQDQPITDTTPTTPPQQIDK